MSKFDPRQLADYKEELPLEDGWYTGKITNIQVDKTKKGVPQIIVRMMTIDGPPQSSGEPASGRELTDFILTDFSTYTDKARNYLQKKLHQFVSALEMPTKKAWDWDDAVDKEVELRLRSYTNEDGDVRADVKAYRTPVEDAADSVYDED